MFRLRRVRKPVRNLTEEAATHFLGRLLSLRRKAGLTQVLFGRQIGVSPETLCRWQRTYKVPAGRAREICQLLKIQEPQAADLQPLSQPPDFGPSVRQAVGWDARARLQRERLAVGYAAVWLASQLTGRQMITDVQTDTGVETLPTSRMIVKDGTGVPKAHIQFSVKDGRLVYQAYSHREACTALLEFEGLADQLGFDFCLEFLLQRQQRPGTAASMIGTKMERKIQKYHDRKRRTSPQ